MDRAEALDARMASVAEKCGELRRHTLAAVWEIGRDLDELKRELAHGAWGPFLDRCGIVDRTARRWMAIAREWPTVPPAPEEVETVTAALQLIQHKAKRPAAKPVSKSPDPVDAPPAAVSPMNGWCAMHCRPCPKALYEIDADGYSQPIEQCCGGVGYEGDPRTRDEANAEFAKARGWSRMAAGVRAPDARETGPTTGGGLYVFDEHGPPEGFGADDRAGLPDRQSMRPKAADPRKPMGTAARRAETAPDASPAEDPVDVPRPRFAGPMGRLIEGSVVRLREREAGLAPGADEREATPAPRILKSDRLETLAETVDALRRLTKGLDYAGAVERLAVANEELRAEITDLLFENSELNMEVARWKAKATKAAPQ